MKKERDPGWRIAVALFALGTAIPIAAIVASLLLLAGVAQVVAFILGVVAVVVVAPFWPPLLCGDVDRVNAMIARRQNKG